MPSVPDPQEEIVYPQYVLSMLDIYSKLRNQQGYMKQNMFCNCCYTWYILDYER